MKEYNDYKLASEQEYDSMKKAYIQNNHSDIDDLHEILEKMKYQRDAIKSENKHDEFANIIPQFDSDIAELTSLLNASEKVASLNSKNPSNKAKYFHKSISKNALNTHVNNYTKSQQTSTLKMQTPVNIQRGCHPYAGMTLFGRISRRLHRNLSCINKRLRCGCNNDNLRNNSNLSDQLTPSPFFPESPTINNDYGINFDSGLGVTSQCNPRQKLHTNQIDLIRLLLLFMALRPNHPYGHRICNITLRQFEILTQVSLS